MNAYDNILYVLTQGAYLAKDGERVLVRVDEETRLAVPLHTLGGIVTFGAVTASPFLLGAAVERGVCVSMFTENGRFLARVEGPVSGNIRLRRAQYRSTDAPAACGELAAAFVIGKLANQRVVLMRRVREYPRDAEVIRPAAAQLAGAIAQLVRMVREGGGRVGPDVVRGIEGSAAAAYFGVFDHLLTAQKGEFFFRERSRRPPLDNVNALLSFVYTLLTHDVRAALEGVGLDPQAGFLHRDRPGRPGLALDMVEELRPVLADRLVLSLVNRRQVEGAGFKRTASGAVEMTDATRRTVLSAYQERKREEIRHPFLDKTMRWSLVPHVQARLLARHLRGELDAYPAFFWR